MNNTMAWVGIFEKMTPRQRRWAFIAVKMAEKPTNFTDIAKRHRLSGWFVGACARGKRRMTARCCAALAADLGIDLEPFLTPDELHKIGRTRVEAAPTEEVI